MRKASRLALSVQAVVGELGRYPVHALGTAAPEGVAEALKLAYFLLCSRTDPEYGPAGVWRSYRGVPLGAGGITSSAAGFSDRWGGGRDGALGCVVPSK